MVDTISLRSTFVATTGVLYSLAKVGEFVLKLPQTIGATVLLAYGAWLALNIAVEAFQTSILRRH